MNSIAIQARNYNLQSRYIPEVEEKKDIPDKETLENLAALMGVNIQEIEAQIAEQERLHQLAWKKARKSKGQSPSSVTSFMQVVDFQGKQLFWSLAGQEFVIGANGKRFTETTIKGALHRLACE